MAFLTFLPFILQAKGASLQGIGLALTFVFAGGAVGKLVCAFIGARIGVIPTVLLTEGLTGVRNFDVRTEVETLASATGFRWIRKAVTKVDELLELLRRNIQKGIALDAFVLELRAAA